VKSLASDLLFKGKKARGKRWETRQCSYNVSSRLSPWAILPNYETANSDYYLAVRWNDIKQYL